MISITERELQLEAETRGYRPEILEKVHRLLDLLETFMANDAENALTKTMRQKAKEMDSTEFMSMWAGQSAALSRRIGANELLNQLVIEVNDFLSSWGLNEFK